VKEEGDMDLLENIQTNKKITRKNPTVLFASVKGS
jgi:hypothetical protein